MGWGLYVSVAESWGGAYVVGVDESWGGGLYVGAAWMWMSHGVWLCGYGWS